MGVCQSPPTEAPLRRHGPSRRSRGGLWPQPEETRIVHGCFVGRRCPDLKAGDGRSTRLARRDSRILDYGGHDAAFPAARGRLRVPLGVRAKAAALPPQSTSRLRESSAAPATGSPTIVGRERVTVPRWRANQRLCRRIAHPTSTCASVAMEDPAPTSTPAAVAPPVSRGTTHAFWTAAAMTPLSLGGARVPPGAVGRPSQSGGVATAVHRRRRKMDDVKRTAENARTRPDRLRKSLSGVREVGGIIEGAQSYPGLRDESANPTHVPTAARARDARRFGPPPAASPTR